MTGFNQVTPYGIYTLALSNASVAVQWYHNMLIGPRTCVQLVHRITDVLRLQACKARTDRRRLFECACYHTQLMCRSLSTAMALRSARSPRGTARSQGEAVHQCCVAVMQSVQSVDPERRPDTRHTRGPHPGRHVPAVGCDDMTRTALIANACRFQHVVHREYSRVFGHPRDLAGQHIPYGLPTAQIPTDVLGDFSACMS